MIQRSVRFPGYKYLDNCFYYELRKTVETALSLKTISYSTSFEDQESEVCITLTGDHKLDGKYTHDVTNKIAKMA